MGASRSIAAGPFSVGARSSLLSLAQTRGALEFLAHEIPGFKARIVTFATPGDRDLSTPIEASAPDFFTRDLDDAVRAGTIDFALHSAKDLPPEMAPDLDWFWLPCREDPRDAWVFPVDAPEPTRRSPLRIGVSSARRRAYAQSAYPRARLLPIRGAIDARLEQIRDGRYDAVLMALAGLIRLYPEGPEGVRVVPIPVTDLEPPEAQGVLAVVFRAGNACLQAVRTHFVKAVRFVSAGVGSADLCTCAGVRDLESADVVLYDDLLGSALLRHVPSSARCIAVGKRCGAHTMPQDKITQMICNEARKGRRVVRLKGGDAGLFGRLVEETEALTALGIPFVVRPGVSALVAATTGTGMLLTRRGESRGFLAYTPRSTGSETPQVAFMATRCAVDEAKGMIASGWSPETPCAMVYDAAGPREEVVRATLATWKPPVDAEDRPGLFVVGRVAAHAWPKLGLLAGARVLVTCSQDVLPRAVRRVEDLGGRPISFPLIALEPSPKCVRLVRQMADWPYDGIVLTSPAAVRIFFTVYAGDRRQLPTFYTCGAGTAAELEKYGVASDVTPAKDFSAAGLIAEIARLDLSDRRILRLRSAKAGSAVARALRKAGAKVDDVVLYENRPLLTHDSPPLPPFDSVWFCSASAVEVFLVAQGAAALRNRTVFVMGEPTRAALPPRLRARARVLTTFA